MTRLILIGAGPIGRESASACLNAGAVGRVVLAVDPDTEARRAAADAFGCQVAEGFRATGRADHGDVALLAFSSRGDATAPAVLEVLNAGFHVVTTCEELSDPHGSWRSRLDGAAHVAGRSVVATGANPGFVMDRLPLSLAHGTSHVRRITVTRRVDTSLRRAPLVAKTGRGLSETEFRAGAAAGALGHVGLGVSLRLVADGLGWDTGPIAETIEPVMEGKLVAGLHQRASAATGEGAEVTLELTMAWNLSDPIDRVVIEGEPPIVNEIVGGYHGDRGTEACVVDAVRRIATLSPGLWLPSGFV